MTNYRIFDTVSVPTRHRGGARAKAAEWLTWSKAFRGFVAELDREGVLRHRVLLKNVRGCAPYSASYHLPMESLPARLQTKLLMFAAHLSRWRVRGELWLFRDMLGPPFDAGRIRAVFAALRTGLVTLTGDERAALYAPVTPERKDPGFSLHADLFLTTRLWLIFDDVPEDGTGASLFVSRAELLSSLRSIKTIPDRTVRQVATFMTRPIARDSFDRLYGILHGEHHHWHDSLSSVLSDKATVIPLGRGEGYLVDDREWLHGRTPASRPVTARRFHRLTFGLRS